MRLGLPAAVCALATHALLYGTLWPADGAHGYFGWYEPAVAMLSLACVAGLLGFLCVATVARRLGRPLQVRSSTTQPDLAGTARGIAAGSLALLLAQETVERSLQAGRPSFALFTPSQWLVLLAGIAVTTLLLACALHACRAALRRALGDPSSSAVTTRPVAAGWSLAAAVLRRPRPLAARGALRAPPLLLG
jgi:hypothetical protein